MFSIFLRFNYVIALKKLYRKCINKKLQLLEAEELNAIAALLFFVGSSCFSQFPQLDQQIKLSQTLIPSHIWKIDKGNFRIAKTKRL